MINFVNELKKQYPFIILDHSVEIQIITDYLIVSKQLINNFMCGSRCFIPEPYIANDSNIATFMLSVNHNYNYKYIISTLNGHTTAVTFSIEEENRLSSIFTIEKFKKLEKLKGFW